MTRPWKAVILVTGIVFAASLFLPNTRELHILSVRLMLHWRGKTYVQGQPPGCTTYIIPNVQFTETFQKELQNHSADSPEKYILASSVGNWLELPPPTARAWSDHPLLDWAAFRMTWLASSKTAVRASNSSIPTMTDTNFDAGIARGLVLQAEKADSTNGALWLAEAVLDFGVTNTSRALSNLRIAVEKGHWSSHGETSFDYLASLYYQAGLSKLDAAIAAGEASSDTAILVLCRQIQRNLVQLLQQSAEMEDDRHFSEVLKLFDDLRDKNWEHDNIPRRNILRSFVPDEAFVVGMAAKTGMAAPPKTGTSGSDITSDKEFRSHLLRQYFSRHADAKLVERFFLQAELGQTESADYKKRIADSSNSTTLYGAGSSLAGLSVLFIFSLLVVAAAFELAFWKLDKNCSRSSRAPIWLPSWLPAIAAPMAGTLVMADFLLTIGIYSQVGFGPTPPPPFFSPLTESLVISFVLCSAWFAALLGYRRKNPEKFKSWKLLIIFTGIYCIAIFAGAFFRSKTVYYISLFQS